MRHFLPTACTMGALTAGALMASASTARAQDIEPRAYSNAPVGVNFLIAGYAYTRGRVAFDDRSARAQTGTLSGACVRPATRVLDQGPIALGRIPHLNVSPLGTRPALGPGRHRGRIDRHVHNGGTACEASPH